MSKKLYNKINKIKLIFCCRYFSLIGPRSIEKGEDYVAVLSSTNFSVPVDLKVSILKRENMKTIATKSFWLTGLSQEVKFNVSFIYLFFDFCSHQFFPAEFSIGGE